jgi:hypothetical protein
MKKLFLSVLFFFIIPSLFAQENPGKLSFKFGTGLSFHGSGDMYALSFENELNYRISQYLSASFALDYGKSDFGVYVNSSFIQTNANFFVSPFKNTGKHILKLGTGISFMDVTDFMEASDRWIDGVIDRGNYTYDKRNSIGYNLIIEYEHPFSDRFLIGFKLYNQPFTNIDLVTGGFVKFGIKII